MEIVNTIPKIIKKNSEKWGSRVAMAKKNRGIWHTYTWEQYYQIVKYFSLGLIALGLKPGEKVCIIGDNEPGWFWSEFATQAAGGIATGIFTDSIPSEVKYIAEHSDAKFAVVNDQEQTDKFLQIKEELPLLKKVIYWDPKGLKHYNDPILANFYEVVEEGTKYEETHPGAFEQNVEKVKEDDIAFIYYTSGTTGLPKGAILTHKDLISYTRSYLKTFPFTQDDDLFSNFPAAWIADSFSATIPHLLTGARLNFPEETETVIQDIREISPHLMIYGPRQWEGLVSQIQVKIIDAHPLKRFCYHLFLPIGYKVADFKFRGEAPNLFWRALHWIANGVVFRPLRDKFGLNHARFAVTGSSVLSLDTFRLIHAIGVELRQLYSGTESGFISCHGKGEIKFESVGRPAIGTEVRVADSGELLVRSDSLFEGYHKDPDKTRDALIDGWFYTGDAVHINEEGHLIFLDRVKDMGELATGAKYAPQYIEGRLRFSPYIKDAMVIGGKDKDFVSAIVNIDFTMVGKWAERNRVPYTTFVDLSQKKEVAGLVQKDLVRVNGYLPEGSRVKRFVLLHKEFDPDEAELTRTRKLRRGFMEERYRALIDAMYSEKEEIKVEAPVTYRDGRKGVVTTAIKVRTI